MSLFKRLPPKQLGKSLDITADSGLCDLSQVYCPSPENSTATTDIDIIAIHGLDTKSPDTWEYRIRGSNVVINWLTHAKMLQTQVGNARIFTCNWPARLFQKSVPTTLEESSRSLRDSILRHLDKNGYYFSDRPILFIASCLGGVILMKALQLDLLKSNDSSRPRLLNATRGIVFLATPFLGTAFKDMPSWELRVWASLSGVEVTSLIDYTKDSATLRGLVEEFIDLSKARRYHIWTFWEAEKMSLLSKLYLGWTFSERIYYFWPIVLISVLALDSFSLWPMAENVFPPWLPAPGEFLPWLLILWLLWLLNFTVFKPKQLVDEISARALLLPSSRLSRQHVLMNKFKNCEECDYALVANKIQDIIGTIRGGLIIHKADAYIREKHYLSDNRLRIERISGHELDMRRCYINLAIVKGPGSIAHSKNEPKTDDSQPSPFSLSARLNIETPGKDIQVELANVFDEASNGGTTQARRILIRGRAGVGKTTLCKKIVHDFIHCHTWNNMFDRILWVPLRILKHSVKDYTLKGLLRQYFFRPTGEGEIYAKELENALLDTKLARTLFILDGLDEVSEGLHTGSEMHLFLEYLLTLPNLIVTSRPLANVPHYLQPSLELETVGFYPNQVQEYITTVSPTTADMIQPFLQKHRLIQGLVRIPIQLDAFCIAWAEGIGGQQPETMTAIYEAISDHLWNKQNRRLRELSGAKVGEVEPVRLEREHEPIQRFLECLAFNGMYSDVIEFQQNHRDNVMRIHEQLDTWLSKFSLADVSFLRTSDRLSDDSERSYHFFHLTYQEFFAARYFIRQRRDGKDVEVFEDFGKRNSKRTRICTNDFLQKNKYNIRYDIVWRFTAGLLRAHEANCFFSALEQQPLDILGPAHQRLVMHCLNEVNKWEGSQREALEIKLSQWLYLECELTLRSRLVAESEFPDNILLAALDNGPREAILRSVSQPSRYLSEAVVKRIASISKLEGIGLIRLFAIEALRWQPDLPEDVVVAVLVAAMKDKDEKIRTMAKDGLMEQSRLTDACNRALLEIFAEKNDKDVRDGAAYAVRLGSGLPTSSSITILMAILKDKNEDKDFRREAALILQRQPTSQEATAPALIAILKDQEQDEETRKIAAAALGKKLPRTIIAELVAIIEDENENWYIRYATAGALGLQVLSLDEDDVAALVAMFQDDNERIRALAIRVINRQSSLPKAILTALISIIGDKGDKIETKLNREFAAIIMSFLSSLDDDSIAALVMMFQDGNEETRAAATTAMAGQSKLSNVVIVALIAAVQDENKMVQLHAIKTLRSQSILPENAAMALMPMLENNDSDLRHAAFEALKEKTNLSLAAITILTNMLGKQNSDSDVFVRRILVRQSSLPDGVVELIVGDTLAAWIDDETVYALDKQSTLSEAILIALIRAFQTNDDIDQLRVSGTLKRHSPLSRPIVTTLSGLLGHKYEEISGYAASALERESNLDESTVASLVAMLGTAWGAFAVLVLANQSSLLDSIELIISRLKEENQSIGSFRFADYHLGGGEKLLDRVLEAILSSESDGLGENVGLENINFLYRSLLIRSFYEQFCLYIEGDELFISLPNGLKKYKISSVELLEDAIRAGRQQCGTDSGLLWSNPFEEAAS